jgi:LPXTG-motif cell wall-anchored protein
MDQTMLIRVVAGVLFVVVLFILIQRRKKKTSR